MSDYEYEEEYQYEEEPAAEEEDINTKVQLQYFEIQDFIRTGKIDKAIEELQQLYVVCQANNIKNYKVKILNQLLTIYCKNVTVPKIASTLNRITELNKQQKYTQNSVKSIITIVRASDYFHVKSQLEQFISQFNQQIKLKSYLFLLERALEEKDIKESTSMFQIVQSLLQQVQSPSASILLELYSLEIRFNQLTGTENTDKLRQIQLKMPRLQAQAYMSENHISVVKLAIAQTMFLSGNYQNSATNIFQAFLQKAKYGNSAQLKQILKTNALICLLIQDPALRKKDNINTLFHDISIPFKNQTDIQQLISLIDIYERQNIQQFNITYEKVNFKPQSQKYLTIYEKLLFKMKKQKLVRILKSYKTIQFSYIGRRLNLNEREVERIVFELITDEKICGKINDIDSKNKFLQILPPRNIFLEIQAENLRELGKRYLKA